MIHRPPTAVAPWVQTVWCDVCDRAVIISFLFFELDRYGYHVMVNGLPYRITGALKLCFAGHATRTIAPDLARIRQ